MVDGSVWGVLNIEAAEPGALGEADAVLVEAIAASLGSAVHRAELSPTSSARSRRRSRR